jgi:soluble lytic murein transglycosylase-like protein
MRFLKIILIGALSGVPLSALAEDPPPFPEFTFKMGKPPKKGAKNRITVQIEPETGAGPQTAPADGAPDATAKPASYAWFWTQVSPKLSVDGAERLDLAMQSLGDGPDGVKVSSPRFQIVQEIAKRHGADILRATIGTRVSPALALAVISVESSGRTSAVSSKGAQGLMQLMPATAERFGVADSLEPGENIKGGVAYLDWLMREFGDDPILALAGYNAGENAVKSHEGVPPFAETRDYVPKVLAAYDVARALCKTPPVLITDACALNIAMK